MQRVVAFAYTKPPAYPPSLRFAHEKKNMSVPVVERFSDKCVLRCVVLRSAAL